MFVDFGVDVGFFWFLLFFCLGGGVLGCVLGWLDLEFCDFGFLFCFVVCYGCDVVCVYVYDFCYVEFDIVIYYEFDVDLVYDFCFWFFFGFCFLLVY